MRAWNQRRVVAVAVVEPPEALGVSNAQDHEDRARHTLARVLDGRVYVTAPLIGMLLAAELRLRLSPQPVRCAKLHHDNPRRCIFRCGYAR